MNNIKPNTAVLQRVPADSVRHCRVRGMNFCQAHEYFRRLNPYWHMIDRSWDGIKSFLEGIGYLEIRIVLYSVDLQRCRRVSWDTLKSLVLVMTNIDWSTLGRVCELEVGMGCLFCGFGIRLPSPSLEFVFISYPKFWS